MTTLKASTAPKPAAAHTPETEAAQKTRLDLAMADLERTAMAIKAERDALRSQVKALREALEDAEHVMQRAVSDPKYNDRSVCGMAISKARAALAKVSP